jgi:hypothetical protein
VPPLNAPTTGSRLRYRVSRATDGPGSRSNGLVRRRAPTGNQEESPGPALLRWRIVGGAVSHHPMRSTARTAASSASKAAAGVIPVGASTPSSQRPLRRFWMKAWPRMITLAVRSPFEASHWSEARPQASVIGLDPIVRVLGGVVEDDWQKLRHHPDQDVGPVGGDLSRLAVRSDRHREERFAALRSGFLDTDTSMTWTPLH